MHTFIEKDTYSNLLSVLTDNAEYDKTRLERYMDLIKIAFLTGHKSYLTKKKR